MLSRDRISYRRMLELVYRGKLICNNTNIHIYSVKPAPLYVLYRGKTVVYEFECQHLNYWYVRHIDMLWDTDADVVKSDGTCIQLFSVITSQTQAVWAGLVPDDVHWTLISVFCDGEYLITNMTAFCTSSCGMLYRAPPLLGAVWAYHGSPPDASDNWLSMLVLCGFVYPFCFHICFILLYTYPNEKVNQSKRASLASITGFCT